MELRLLATEGTGRRLGDAAAGDRAAEINSTDNGESNSKEYKLEELEAIKMQQNRKVNDKLDHYNELHLSMTFKDKKEAKRVVDLYALTNKKSLRVKQNDRTRLSYTCENGCPFVILVSLDGKGPRFKVKTSIEKHTCEDAFTNPRATTSSLSQYFKGTGRCSEKCPSFNPPHHRYCVRHVEANWMKRFRSGEMKKLLWWASWSTYEKDFKDQLSALGALSEEVVKYLLKFNPVRWCRAYMGTIYKNQILDNNFTESFNSWILEPSGKPILKMLEEIRVKIMNRLKEKKTQVSKWKEIFSPKCMELFIAHKKIAQLCTVNFNGDIGYEMSEGCHWVESSIGVNWGTISLHKMPPLTVVNLLKENKIQKVKLFNADSDVMKGLMGSGLKVMVGIPNDMLAILSSSSSAVDL
ncbi:Glucan endo-1,3-beta-glucosidase 6 [Capsicum baccatum]|uniref:Glucan endo-1,3-beta-glucosidase 6 n=1 Tax=Capsicum baccatum TaxID=33114 RepID=A0A2G2XC72_CAPBA|nr:Glucan endo-1,3-beta-glucosidase 6 [Capsicum baccatum]